MKSYHIFALLFCSLSLLAMDGMGPQEMKEKLAQLNQQLAQEKQEQIAALQAQEQPLTELQEQQLELLQWQLNRLLVASNSQGFGEMKER